MGRSCSGGVLGRSLPAPASCAASLPAAAAATAPWGGDCWGGGAWATGRVGVRPELWQPPRQRTVQELRGARHTAGSVAPTPAVWAATHHGHVVGRGVAVRQERGEGSPGGGVLLREGGDQGATGSEHNHRACPPSRETAGWCRHAAAARCVGAVRCVGARSGSGGGQGAHLRSCRCPPSRVCGGALVQGHLVEVCRVHRRRVAKRRFRSLVERRKWSRVLVSQCRKAAETGHCRATQAASAQVGTHLRQLSVRHAEQRAPWIGTQVCDDVAGD